MSRVAGQLGISPESLRRWVHQAEVDRDAGGGLTTEESERIMVLERENRELRRANEILITAAFFGADLDRRWSRDDHLHRRAARQLRGRADLQDPGDRPIELLRRQFPATLGSCPPG